MTTPEVGSVFGKYRILRPIGRGGMGVVYLAEDQDLGRRVALKILDRSLTSDPTFEERFRQEARLIASLEHPNIVGIHTLERVEDELAIDIPYIEGGSLEQAETGRGLTLFEALHHARDVLDALASCHEAGVIHRDVKPSNILLARDGRALLSDFGLAKLLVTHQTSSILNLSTASLFVGTPRYAPPESWDGQDPSPAWDVFSVGTVLYEAAASALPYDAETPYALIKQMIERPVPPLGEAAPHVSPELSRAVERMMAQEAAQRPQDAREALGLLCAVPELREEAGAGRARPVRRRRRVRRRAAATRLSTGRSWQHRTAVLLSILLFGASLSFGGWWALKPGEVAPDFPPTATPIETSTEQVFDTVEPATQAVWPGHWFMRAAEEEDTWLVTASESTRLWRLTGAANAEGLLELEGHWAEYADGTARVFRHGTMSGVLRWLVPGAEASLSLSFRSTQDGSRWPGLFLLRKPAQQITGKTFLRRIEAAGHIQPLIYNELMPRRLEWASSVEDEFVRCLGPKTAVPRLSAEAGGVHLDGLLDEAEWRLKHLSMDTPSGRIAATPHDAGAEMLLRYDTKGLYAGIRIRHAGAEPSLTLSLLDRYSIPLEFSPCWSAQLEDGAVVASYHTKNGEPAPWACAWQVATAKTDEGWQAELLVPFENLGRPAPPEPGQRWRLNCSAVTTAPGASGQAVSVHWGDPDVSRVEHGMILVFGTHDAFGHTP